MRSFPALRLRRLGWPLAIPGIASSSASGPGWRGPRIGPPEPVAPEGGEPLDSVGNHDRAGPGSGRAISRRLLLGGGAVVAVAGGSALWPTHVLGRLAAGTVAGDVDIGGLGRDEARRRLRERLAAFEAAPVVLRFGSRTWAPSAPEIGVRIDYDATIDAARAAGPGIGGARLSFGFPGSAGPRRTPVAVTVDTATLDAYLGGIASVVAEPARDAVLVVEAGRAAVEPGTDGIALDVAATQASIADVLTRLEPAEIALPTRRVAPRVAPGDLEPARQTVGRLIGSAVVVALDERRWEITPAQLAAALILPDDPLTVPPRLDPATLHPLIDPIADEIDHPPLDAIFGWYQGLVVVDPGHDGEVVDRAALAAAVAAAAGTDRRLVEAPLTAVPADLRPDDIDSLGITTLLASGTSSFAGSSEDRAINVAVATDYVSQTLIPPGGEFSFNHALGPITLDRGYVQGKIILGDWYASAIGGGVCQVSTTVFRAAFFAGLPFPEWNPHSFRLAFYELDGSPPGIDAAIYQSDDPEIATLDLRFANPTDRWMLLQLRIDGERLVAELFGSPMGYEVTLDEPRLSEPIPPPDPIERESDELAPGVWEVAQEAQPGVTVRVVRRVLRGPDLVSETTFVSPYQPQARVILVGPS